MIGIPPNNGGGPALVDQSWLNGLAAGANHNYKNNAVAHAGGGQAAATQIPAAVALYRIATVATENDSVQMPRAVAGTIVMVSNAGAETAAIYAKNGTADQINGAANNVAFALATATSAVFFCALDGQWAAIKSA